MDDETRNEIARLDNRMTIQAADAFATQLVLSGFFQAVMTSSSDGRALVEKAFDYADSISEIGAVKFAEMMPQGYLLKVAEIVERLRAAIL